MSDCEVCLTSDFYDSDGAIDDAQIVTLDRNQRCSECMQIVPAGANIEEATWYEEDDEDDGEVEEKEPIYTCPICAEIANSFYCDGRMYGGGLWDGMNEVWKELTISCFDKLKTPEAKTYLREWWLKKKGLQP
jgi:hypothetical protein